MRLLMIATGYLPYSFSENLCNGKLVYALQKKGWHVDVISKVDEGPSYSAEWTEPWLSLKENNILIRYPHGNSLTSKLDVFRSSISMGVPPVSGIRWAYKAYLKALELNKEHHYDAVLTRSPNDISHLIGLKLKKKLGIKWIANWNDPANPIWPEPYTLNYSPLKQKFSMSFTSVCLNGADINTFPSQSLLDYFVEKFPFLKNQKTMVIPHIELEESIFPKINPPHTNEKFRMCHSGNLSLERNPDNTFRALRNLIDEGICNLEFSIMGYINEYTEALIHKYNLEDYVVCTGSFSYIDALKKMQEFDCLVLLEARLKKGIFFASKFTDYAQVGKPILAISPMDGFAADAIARHGGGISVNNEDWQSIKDGMQRLYNAWKAGTLPTEYCTERLYDTMSVQYVTDVYSKILTEE